ncbi:YfmQ family protein [Cytobacillus praedii]|uniref:YfmQ family protein n=1 Tax=Cytobacillus praedii TaxID=1742358 RepID=UPI003F81A036
MTWTAFIIIILGITLKMLTSPPSAVVNWILSKFALHPTLDSEEVTITFNGNYLEGEEKVNFIDFFNKASFLERNDIFPGDEKLFLHPETTIIPFIIHVKKSKRDMNFFIYCENDQIFVVKQWKRKVASYNLRSDNLQNFTASNSINV